MQDYSMVFKNMTWSFSRIHSYEQCPYEFYLSYLCKDEDGNRIYEGEDNFYGAFGSFCHELLADLYNHNISEEEAYIQYQSEFDDALSGFDVKESTLEKYFYKGLNYFSNFTLKDFHNYEILGVEKQVYFNIGDYRFVGYIDLLLKNKATGEIIIIDHKSSDFPIGKKGGVLKSKQKSYESYKKQLYLYSKAVFEEYGKYPGQLAWNYFKEEKTLSIPFNHVDYAESLLWASQTIHKIEADQMFKESMEHFYCTQLCKFRKGTSTCEYADGGT